MNAQLRYFKLSIGLLAGLILAVPAYAQESSGAGLSLTFMPLSIVSIKGDVARFQQQQWISNGYSWGLKDILYSKDLGDDLSLTFDGKTIPNENDNEAHLSLTKKDVGFMDIAYDSFKKYYDGTGGIYPLFSTLNSNQLSEDLNMNMGRFMLEVGTPKDDVRGVSVVYEHDVKDGKKSRLTWTAVKEGATTRDIGPSWQQVEEVTNSITLKGRTEVKGVAVKGEQLFEKTRINSFREERSLATTGVAADTKIRRQKQEPDSNLLATTLEASKWINEDKTFLGSGYRYQHLNARELEYLNEFDASGAPASYSNPKNKFDAWAKNDYDSHIWNGHIMTKFTEDLAFSAKVRAEAAARRGASSYPDDSTNLPDGIANTTNINEVENKIGGIGENVSLRYNGIARTTLYSELDMSQTRNWLDEKLFQIAGQSAASTSSNFNRETVTNITKTNLTVGSRSVPVRWLNFTTQVRQKWEMNDYDDVWESGAAGSAKSAWIDAMGIKGSEIASRITWKPLKWINPSFRYQFFNNKYITRIENDINETEADQVSHVFTYDLYIQPTDQLLFDFAYSKNDNKISTLAAGGSGSPQIPGFISNSDSWMASASYTPKENLSFTQVFTYSNATNYDNFSSIGLPYGADFDKYDITLEADWKPKEDLSVKPHYAYFFYEPGSSYDNGGYRAHVMWLDVTVKW